MSTTTTKPKPGQTNFVRPSDVELNRAFIAALGKSAEGSNSHAPDLLGACGMLLANYKSFTAQDFYYLCKHKDLMADDEGASEAKKFFELWSLHMCLSKRVTRVSGAYEDDIFIVN